jgi:hypothetical protein
VGPFQALWGTDELLASFGESCLMGQDINLS